VRNTATIQCPDSGLPLDVTVTVSEIGRVHVEVVISDAVIGAVSTADQAAINTLDWVERCEERRLFPSRLAAKRYLRDLGVYDGDLEDLFDS
jgi:hypothetical protein